MRYRLQRHDGTDCSATMVPITVLRMVPIQRYRQMMDAVDKYNPDFIYTDGTDQQPFSSSGTGTGYKCDAMQRVIADFYNKTLDRRGKLLYHRFSFYSRQRWGHLCLVYDCAKGW